MKKKKFLVAVSAVMVIAMGAYPALSAQQSVTLATHAVGSLYNALGTGLASVLSRRSSLVVRVQPFAGPPAWIPSMDTGETDTGLVAAPDVVFASKGKVLYKKPYKNLRILIVGGAFYFGFYVRKASGMETAADLKGKRIPTDFPGIPVVKLSTTAFLATAGLTYNDIVKVPVSDLAAASEAFLEGRTDAGWVGLGGSVVTEADARLGGVKFVAAITTPEGTKRAADIYPGAYPAVVKAGSATGIVKDTPLLANDIYLVATKDLSEETAYEIVKTLWDHNDELGAAFHLLKTWTHDRMVSPRAAIPYHPAAIKFFKEKGAWSKEMDELQAKLLSQ
jgi:TRAP transporter TAXI family solute receptor